MKLIAGKLNSESVVRFWKIEEKFFYVGDYAIVENKNDYDLVKIVGIIETNEKYVSFVTNECSRIKNVISIIPRFQVRKD